jgi:hypothetical protein
MKKIVIVFSVIGLCAAYLWIDSSRHLTFLNSELTWRWQHYWQFDNDKQLARTQDTHQLIMRQVDLKHKRAVFVATTLDSKFDVVVMHEKPCKPGESIKASLTIEPSETVAHDSQIELVCNESGNAAMYRQAWKKLPDIEIKFTGFSIDLNLSDWNIDELKKDEFLQRHPQFSKRVNADNNYPWARD